MTDKKKNSGACYFRINYCSRKHCGSWADWAWWYAGPHRTYFADIETVRFCRVLGVEFHWDRWIVRSSYTGIAQCSLADAMNRKGVFTPALLNPKHAPFRSWWYRKNEAFIRVKVLHNGDILMYVRKEKPE